METWVVGVKLAAFTTSVMCLISDWLEGVAPHCGVMKSGGFGMHEKTP